MREAKEQAKKVKDKADKDLDDAKQKVALKLFDDESRKNNVSEG